jgi:uncharacterized membrane-anchored protein
MADLGRTLLYLGLSLVVFALIVLAISRLGLPKLPGDIVIQRPGFTFAFPIATCVVISIVLTIVVNLLFHRK